MTTEGVTLERTWPVRAARRLRNREALLAAAAELLSDRGYAQCSLSEIAQRAGLSTGAVYANFGSKAELFLELIHGRARLPALEPPSAVPDFVGVLEALGRHWAQVVSTPDARKMLELSYELQLAALREPAVLTRVAQLQLDDERELAEQFERAASARGCELPIPAEELAVTVIAALQGLTEQAVLRGTPADPDRFADVARRLLAV